MYFGSLFKQNNVLEKKFPTTVETGSPLLPPHYTKNRNVSDLLDTPGPKDEMPAYSSDAEPGANEGKSSVNQYRTIGMVGHQKRVRH